MHEKAERSRKTVCSRCFVAPKVWWVGLRKRRVQSHLVIWEIKKCTPLWREARSQTKSVKRLTVLDHFWKSRCQKSACRCGANHVRKSKVLQLMVSDHCWKSRCRKSARRCGRKHVRKSKVSKTDGLLLYRFWKSRCQKGTQLQRQQHYYTKLHYTTLH